MFYIHEYKNNILQLIFSISPFLLNVYEDNLFNSFKTLETSFKWQFHFINSHQQHIIKIGFVLYLDFLVIFRIKVKFLRFRFQGL